jgi:hypothetical protein
MKELITIQSELSAPKNQRNDYGNYKYRSCEDVLEALKPLLLKTSCTLTISDSLEAIGDRIYIKATAVLRNSAGETESVSAYAREPLARKGMDDSQITGSTSSYARKFALSGLFAIDDNKDPDVTNTHGKDEEPAPAPEPQDKPVQPTVAKAIAEANAAKTVAELTTVWNKFPQFKADASFKKAVADKNRSFQSK